MKRLLFCIFTASTLLLFGCSDSTQQSASPNKGGQSRTEPPDSTDGNLKKESGDIVFGDKFPEVLAVEATHAENNRWRFNVTLSSPYDSPERYADAWRVVDDQDNELGIRILGHDHAAEQPFTRSGTIQLPQQTSEVFVEGRDQANGWSGQRFEFKLPEKETSQ